MGKKNNTLKLHDAEEIARLISEKQPERAIKTKSSSESLIELGFKPSSINLTKQHNQASELFRLSNSNVSIDNEIDYNAELSALQGKGEEWSRASLQFFKGLGSGFLEAVASWDLSDIKDMALSNAEKEYGNWLNQSKLVKDLKNNIGLEIYRDGDDFGSSAYWANMFGQSGHTIGVILEALAEQAALSALTTTTFGGSSGLQVASLGSKARLLKNIFKGGFGVIKGVQEGYMNALETYDRIYQEMRRANYSHEEAVKKASEGASTNYKMEVGPLVLLNGISYLSMFGKFGKTLDKASDAYRQGKNFGIKGFSDLGEGLIEKVLPNVSNKIGAKTISYGVNSALESIEEGIQTGIGNYVTHNVLKGTKADDYKDFELFNEEMRDSMLSGAVMGSVFKGLGDAYNKGSEKLFGKSFDTRYNELLENMGSNFEKSVNKITTLTKERDDLLNSFNQTLDEKTYIEYKKKQRELQKEQNKLDFGNVTNALHYDYLKGEGTVAFDSYIEQFKRIKESVDKKDIDTLAKLGLYDKNNKTVNQKVLDDIVQNYDKKIKQAEKIKNNLGNNLLNYTSDFESALKITFQQHLLEDIETSNSESKNILNSLYENSNSFNQMSEDGQKRFKLEVELEALNNLSKLNESQKKRKKEITEELKNTPQYNNQDKILFDTENNLQMFQQRSGVDGFVSLHQNIEENNQQKENILNKIKDLTDPKNIKKEILDRKKKDIQNAKTKKDLEEQSKKNEEDDLLTEQEKALLDQIKEKQKKKIEVQTPITGNQNPINTDLESKKKEISTNTGVQENSKSSERVSDFADNFDYQSEFETGIILSDVPDIPGLETIDGFPSVHQSNNSKDEKTNSYLNGLAEELGKKREEITLEDIVRDLIEGLGFERTSKIFDNTLSSLEKAGIDISEKENIKNKYLLPLSKRREEFAEAFSEQEITENNTEIIENIENEQPKNNFDIVNEDSRILDDRPKLAFLGQQYDQISKDGSVRRTNTSQLNEDTKVGNHFVLDYEAVKEGTELEVSIPDNYLDIIVTDWYLDANNNWVRREIPFGEWMKIHNVKEGSEHFYNKVPMITSLNGKPVSYIHDTDWYNSNNISNREGVFKQNEIIEKGRKNISSLRQTVGKNKEKGKIKITQIKHAGLTNLNEINKHNPSVSPEITLEEATGKSTLAVSNSAKQLFNSKNSTHSNGVIGNNRGQVQVVNQDFIPNNAIMELREVAPGKFVTFFVKTNHPSKGENLPQQIKNNVYWAILSNFYLNSDESVRSYLEEKFGISQSIATNIVNKIKETSFIDIQSNLGEYIKMFVAHTNKESTLVEVLNSTDHNKYPVGNTFVSIDPKTNTIKFVNKDGNPVPINDSGYNTLVGIPTNKKFTGQNITTFMSLLENLSNLLDKTTMSIDKNKIEDNSKSFILIDERGQTSLYQGNIHGDKSYTGFMKTHLKTSIKSHKIVGVDGQEKWVTVTQPTIHFELVGDEVKPNTTAVSNDDVTRPQQEIKREEQAKKEEIKPEDVNPLDTQEKEFLEEKQKLKNFLDSGVLSKEDYKLALNILSQQYKIELDSFNSPYQLTEDDIEFFKNQFDTIEGLTLEEQKDLIEGLFHQILSEVSKGKKLDLNELKAKLKTRPLEIIQQLKQAKEQLKSKLDNVGYNTTYIQSSIDKLSLVENQIDKLTKDEELDRGILLRKFENLLSEQIDMSVNEEVELEVSEDLLENDNGEIENNYSQSAMEKNVKLSFSKQIKIFMNSIPKLNKDGDPVLNSLGIIKNMSLEETVLLIQDITTKTNPSINEILKALEEKNEQTRLIAKRLREAPSELQKELVYKLTQSNLTMYTAMIENNGQKISLFDSNSNGVLIREQSKIKQSILNSKLYKNVNGEKVLDKEFANTIVDKITNFQKDIKTENLKSLLTSIFKDLEIEFEDNVIDKIIEKQGVNLLSSSGLIGGIKQSLLNSLRVKENLSKHFLFDENKNFFSEFIEENIDLNGTSISKSFRVNGKTLQATVQRNMTYDILMELKNTNSDLFKHLLQSPYSKNNMLLQLLQENESFYRQFAVEFVSLESLKERGVKNYLDARLNSLSEKDNIVTQIAFMGSLGKSLGNSNIPGVKLRMGKMFAQTQSDKDQSIMFNTAILDLNENNFSKGEGQNLNLNSDLLDFIVQQLFESEFDRIVQTLNEPTNISKYNDFGKMFLNIPIYNTIKIKNNEGDLVNILDLLQEHSNNPKIVQDIKEKALIEAKTITQNFINHLVKEKVDFQNQSGEWFEQGLIKRTDKKENGKTVYETQYIDQKYLDNKHKGSQAQKVLTGAYDYVINQLLNYKNVSDLFLGDSALYGGKIIKDEHKNIDFVKTSQLLNTNMLKRTAMLIAPGNKLANSYGDSYYQIFVNDPVTITSSARSLLKQVYGEVSEKNEKWISELEEIDNKIKEEYTKEQSETQREENLKSLRDRQKVLRTLLEKNNLEVGAYFQIEGTDAQEYVTWKEHLRILEGQGRLSDEQKETLTQVYEKLSKGEELNSEELKFIMQPIKPVYTGPNQSVNGVNRIVYIKSSSVPLLPQLTKGFKLDEIRKKMEQLEKVKEKNVRLSYQTANKVGSVDTKLTTDDLYNLSFEELLKVDENNNHSGLLEESILELDRNYFRIQQDTPYKTDKYLEKNSEDYISLGSQMWKIILANGINEEGRVFPNTFGSAIIDLINKDEEKIKLSEDGKLNGKELEIIKNYVEEKYLDKKLFSLYDEIGIDKETGEIKDRNKTIRKMFDLLKREANSRDYPDYIKDEIELYEELGETYFSTPLWLSNGSQKFESLLLSVISNKLIFLKLPGTSHITTSSEGFVLKEDVKGDDILTNKIKSEILWVDPNHSGELKATRLENGELKEAEVLVQSKFRITKTDENGNEFTELIDLRSKDENGNYIYLDIQDGKYVLKEDMIDKDLLTQFSFRIPTSAHQSGAILKIVGFLPEASGDVLVVPKEHTKQIGEDYDIDKRNLYRSHYIVDENGKIKKLKSEDLSEELKKKEELNILKQELKDLIQNSKELSKQYQKLDNIEDDTINEKDLNEFLNFVSSIDKNLEKQFRDIEKLQKENKYLRISLKEKIKELSKEMVSKKVLDKLEEKILENAMIDVYKAVYLSNSKSVQDRINKVLSFDVASETVDKIKEQTQKNIDNTYYTLLSDKVQRENLKNGADGKLGTAIHSRMVVFQAQLERSGGFTIMEKIDTEDGSYYKPSFITIGNYTSNGKLGEKKTLDGKRSIADVHSENQNASVDNIKAQIMGYRNENKHTINVLAQLTLRGFDIDSQTGLHIPSLFLAQPILRDYVALKEKYESITNKDFGNIEDKIYQELSKKYNFSNDQNFDISERLTGQTLLDNLNSNTVENEVQQQVFKTFIKLKEESENIGNYISLLNISSRGLGISYFETLQKMEDLKNLAVNPLVKGLNKTLGEFDVSEISSSGDVTLSKNEFGYYQIGYKNNQQISFKPTTPEGHQLVKALEMSYKMLDEHYTYNRIDFDYIEKQIDKELSIKQKQEIVTAYRDYVYSGLSFYQKDFNETDSLKREREKLFLRTQNNTPLGDYLQSLKKSNSKIIRSFVNTNPLLNSLEISETAEQDKNVVIIKHESTIDDTYSFNDKYQAFLQLLTDNKTDLGTWNGEQMTPMKLAQNLATYAFLANEEGGAIGFRKFIHKKYLDKLDIPNQLRNTFFVSPLDFTKQMLLHKPHLLKTINEKSLNPNWKFESINYINSQEIKVQNFKGSPHYVKIEFDDETLLKGTPQVIKVKDNNKAFHSLYTYVGKKEGKYYYKLTPQMGQFGYNEYSFNQDNVYNPNNSQIKNSQYEVYNEEEVKTYENIENEVDYNPSNHIDTNKSLVQNLKELASKSNNQKLKDLVDRLLPFVNNNVNFKIVDNLKEALKQDFPNADVSNQSENLGKYIRNNNTIYILNQFNNKDFVKLNSEQEFIEKLLQVFTEEIIHSITVTDLKKWLPDYKGGRIDLKILSEKTPLYVKKLVSLYNQAFDRISDENFDEENYSEKAKFHSKYYTKDIFEFVAGVFVDEYFREVLDTIEDKTIKKSLLQMFKEAIRDFLRYFTGAKYSDVSVNTVFDLLNKKSDKDIEFESKYFNQDEIRKSDDDSLIEELNNITDDMIKDYFKEQFEFKQIENYLKENNIISVEEALKTLENNKIIKKPC